MADISKVRISGVDYNVKDATARAGLSEKLNIADCGGIHVRQDYIISDVDLIDGVSELEAGKLYFYYEA